MLVAGTLSLLSVVGIALFPALERQSASSSVSFGPGPAAVALAPRPSPVPARAPSAPSGSRSQGTMDVECVGCHEDAALAVTRTAHTALDRDGAASHWGAESSCTGCHGEATEHVENFGDGPVFTFDADPVENTARCLDCHDDNHPSFPRSEHARAGLDCGACHESHPAMTSPPLDLDDAFTGRPSAVCVDCHQSVLAEFRLPEHHRLEEGSLECTSCHDPHAPQERLRLADFGQRGCIECHVDKGGPFVFEHGGQLVEGCTSCHAPHGSPNRHMLQFQQVAELCYSCHAFVPGFHTRFTVETQCTSCHVTIHGSNLDPAYLK